MNRAFLAASLLATTPLHAVEPLTPTLWEITLTRTDQASKILSQAKAPIAVYPTGLFDTSLVIDMGSAGNPRLWTVDCFFGGTNDKLLEFEVSDTTRTSSWTSNGSSLTRAVELFDVETVWHGPGRYVLFTMDGETLTADLHPATAAKNSKTSEADPTVIVVTRRDRSRKILSQTTAPWPAAGDDRKCNQLLTIQFGTKESPQTRLVRCLLDRGAGALTFQIAFLLPLATDLSGTQVKKVDVLNIRTPINETGKYLIHALDGETLEAEIRNPVGAKSPPPEGDE
jgi:hypothetical protein